MRLLVLAAVAGLLAAPAPAAADTPGCASHAEVDALIRGLSVSQVAGRLDTNGVYVGSGDENFRRAYDVCWSADRRLIVWYSLTTGLSTDWDVRDL